MPKQTRETNTEGIEGEGINACIHETNKFMLCFPEVFQQLMTDGVLKTITFGILREKKNRFGLTQ